MTTQIYQPKQDYVLTDGVEIFATRLLTQDEVEELNRQAKAASDGEVWWELKVTNQKEVRQ